MSEPITQADFARRHNVSRQAIHDLVNRGVIVLAGGLVDEAAALQAIAETRDPARVSKILISGPAPSMNATAIPPLPEAAAAPPTDEEAISFHKAKTRRELAEAMRAELRLAIEQSEYVELALVLRTWANLVNVARIKFLAIPGSPDIPESLRPHLTQRITDTLHELSRLDPAELITTE